MTDAEADKVLTQLRIKKAVEDEREACARLAETINVCGGPNGQPIAAAIRARGK